jgi:hypothetical protein
MLRIGAVRMVEAQSNARGGDCESKRRPGEQAPFAGPL